MMLLQLKFFFVEQYRLILFYFILNTWGIPSISYKQHWIKITILLYKYYYKCLLEQKRDISLTAKLNVCSSTNSFFER